MARALQKAFAIIGGLIIGIGVVWLASTIITLNHDTMIILGVILTIFASASLYFMTKSAQ